MSFISLVLCESRAHPWPNQCGFRNARGRCYSPPRKRWKLGRWDFPKKMPSVFNKRKVQGCCRQNNRHPLAPSACPLPRARPLGTTSLCKCWKPTTEAHAAHGRMASAGPLITFPNGLCSWNPLMRSKLASHIYLDVDSGSEAFDDLLTDPPNLVPPCGPC